MTHEQFIALSTAKLAKQAGFDWESRFDNQQQCDEWQQVALVEVSNPDYNDAMGDPYSDEYIPFMSPTMFVMLPHVTQSVLQRWLREVKGYQVTVFLTPQVIEEEDCDPRYEFDPNRYGYHVENLNDKGCVEMDDYNCIGYEAALEAGLQKCLTLLIKEL